MKGVIYLIAQVYGQFFSRRGGQLSHLCPKIFSTASEKTAMLTCKITLPDSPHPGIISRNPDFGHFISLDRKNSVFLGVCRPLARTLMFSCSLFRLEYITTGRVLLIKLDGNWPIIKVAENFMQNRNSNHVHNVYQQFTIVNRTISTLYGRTDVNRVCCVLIIAGGQSVCLCGVIRLVSGTGDKVDSSSEMLLIQIVHRQY